MLEGNLDQADRTALRGWVRDPAEPDQPVSLLVTVNGEDGGRILANVYRYDLEQLGLNHGRFGFLVNLQGLSPLFRYVLRVQREGDGLDIPGSPVTLEPAVRLDVPALDALSAVLGLVDTDDEARARIAFLAAQLDRLQQTLADRQGGRQQRQAHQQFRNRWAPDTKEAAAAEPAKPQPRALFIDSTSPVLQRDAGSHALMSHMRSVQRLGYAVTFAPADMTGHANAMLADTGIDNRAAPWSGSVEEVLRREAGLFDLVYLHRVANARYIPLLRSYLPRARLVFSVADLHHLRLARQAEIEERPELLDHSRALRQAEFGSARACDAVVTHSTFEAMLLRLDLPAAHVHLVPWGVQPRPVTAPFAQRRGLAFIGGYQHPPNLDAAHWLLHSVMPLVWRYDPEIVCALVGSNMPDSLREAASDPRVLAPGQVADLATVFESVRLTVAPLGFGAGVKGKVLESLAAGVPCACTPIAAEGLALPLLLLGQVADGAEALAAVIYRLHSDETLNGVCSAAGLAYVEDQLSDARIDAAMAGAVGLKKPQPTA